MNTKLNTKLILDKALLDIPKYINQPQYVPNKNTGYLIQSVGWSLWMMLFFPLLTLAFWWYQGTLIQKYLFSEQSDAHVQNLIYFGSLIFIFMVSLIVWANYNWFRFRREDRRCKPENTPLERLAKSFGVSTAQLFDLKASKRMVLHYDEQGKLTRYEMDKTN